MAENVQKVTLVGSFNFGSSWHHAAQIVQMNLLETILAMFGPRPSSFPEVSPDADRPIETCKDRNTDQDEHGLPVQRNKSTRVDGTGYAISTRQKRVRSHKRSNRTKSSNKKKRAQQTSPESHPNPANVTNEC